MASWRESFFRKGVFTPGMKEALVVAPAESRFIWKTLRLKPGARVLDVCCGTGRHAIPLAKRGAAVTGIDFNAEYLAQARQSAKGLKTLSLSREDMRRMPFRGEFDAAYNVWTSFGYFERFSDDLRALRSIARALKPGGLFLIDIIDFAWLKRHHEPLRFQEQADGAWRVEEVFLRRGGDPAMDNRWTILRRGQAPVSSDFFVRGYDERRMRAVLRAAGFTPLRRWRALDGGSAGPRLVLLARKA